MFRLWRLCVASSLQVGPHGSPMRLKRARLGRSLSPTRKEFRIGFDGLHDIDTIACRIAYDDMSLSPWFISQGDVGFDPRIGKPLRYRIDVFDFEGNEARPIDRCMMMLWLRRVARLQKAQSVGRSALGFEYDEPAEINVDLKSEVLFIKGAAL